MNDATQGNAQQDSRLPRGALIVVAVGLVACVVAALAATSKGEGEAATLEWVQNKSFPDTKAIALAGGKGTMSLVNNSISATGVNVSGYSLFRAGSTLRISSGAPIGGSRILCTIQTGRGTEIGQTNGGLRATYPRSSEDGIYNQEVPEAVFVEFSSHGSEVAQLEITGLPKRFTDEQGVKLEWPEYEVGKERLKYFITGKPKQELTLPFFTIWKTTASPAAKIACRLTTSAGNATVRTQVALAKPSPPINEQAEEEKSEEREEAEEKEEAEEG
ncbi:MAG: hypothetical protein ACTHNP_04020 [Solirubrobacterales bacterium]